MRWHCRLELGHCLYRWQCCLLRWYVHHILCPVIVAEKKYHLGHKWTAKWWNQAEAPGTASGYVDISYRSFKSILMNSVTQRVDRQRRMLKHHVQAYYHRSDNFITCLFLTFGPSITTGFKLYSVSSFRMHRSSLILIGVKFYTALLETSSNVGFNFV